MSDEDDALYQERLKLAVSMMKRPDDEQLKVFAKAEEAAVCRHCGRCVIVGPPCCYNHVLDLYNKAQGEILWYRKVVSKKDKLINKLRKEIESLKENK